MIDNAIIPAERIERTILIIRGQRVIIDADLAELYGVATKVLNQAVKRNSGRFPEDFMFQLTGEEAESLRSQFVTLKPGGRGRHSKYLPYAFTEHGAIMAANVLNSERAAKVSVLVVRAFVRLRQLLATHTELAQKLAELEARLDGHDRDIRELVHAIRQLMAPPPAPKKKPIGFASEMHGRTH